MANLVHSPSRVELPINVTISLCVSIMTVTPLRPVWPVDSTQDILTYRSRSPEVCVPSVLYERPLVADKRHSKRHSGELNPQVHHGAAVSLHTVLIRGSRQFCFAICSFFFIDIAFSPGNKRLAGGGGWGLGERAMGAISDSSLTLHQHQCCFSPVLPPLSSPCP